MTTLPNRLWVHFKKLLGNLFVLKFDENGPLEQLIIRTAKADCIRWPVWREEGLNIELRARLLVAEAFYVD
jgi:hypothetical protein